MVICYYILYMASNFSAPEIFHERLITYGLWNRFWLQFGLYWSLHISHRRTINCSFNLHSIAIISNSPNDQRPQRFRHIHNKHSISPMQEKNISYVIANRSTSRYCQNYEGFSYGRLIYWYFWSISVDKRYRRWNNKVLANFIILEKINDCQIQSK